MQPPGWNNALAGSAFAPPMDLPASRLVPQCSCLRRFGASTRTATCRARDLAKNRSPPCATLHSCTCEREHSLRPGREQHDQHVLLLRGSCSGTPAVTVVATALARLRSPNTATHGYSSSSLSLSFCLALSFARAEVGSCLSR